MYDRALRALTRIFSAFIVTGAVILSATPAKAEMRYANSLELGFMVEDQPSLARTVNMSKGERIVIEEFLIWSMDSSDWDNGGTLVVFSSDYYGPHAMVACHVGDDNLAAAFMDEANRETVRELTGTIGSYSKSSGLVIENCTWKR